MMKLHCSGSADAREENYRLLTGRGPTKIVVDTDLPDGEWYVVRGRTPQEQMEDDAREAAWAEAKARLAKVAR